MAALPCKMSALALSFCTATELFGGPGERVRGRHYPVVLQVDLMVFGVNDSAQCTLFS